MHGPAGSSFAKGRLRLATTAWSVKYIITLFWGRCCHHGNSHSAAPAPEYGPEPDTGRRATLIWATSSTSVAFVRCVRPSIGLSSEAPSLASPAGDNFVRSDDSSGKTVVAAGHRNDRAAAAGSDVSGQATAAHRQRRPPRPAGELRRRHAVGGNRGAANQPSAHRQEGAGQRHPLSREPDSGARQKLGDVATGVLPVTWASNGVGGQQIMVTSGGRGYIFDLASDTFHLIEAAHFPANVIACAYLQTYFLVLPANSRQFHYSAQFNGLEWSAGDVAQKSNTPDVLRGLIVHDDVVRLIGSRTTETWYNSGDALTPFSPVQGGIIDAGMGPLETTQFVGGALIVLGSSKDGGAGEAWALTGQDPPVLTPAGVSRAWSTYDVTSDAYSYAYREASRWFYVVSFPTAKKTWVYDHTSKMWHRRSLLTSRGEEHHLARCHTVAFGRKHFVGSRVDGTIYEQSLEFFDDAGSEIRRVRRAPHVWDKNRMITVDRLEVYMQTGVARLDGQGSEPLLMLRYSVDGGHTWSDELLGDAGRTGAYGLQIEWRSLGQGEDWVFELASSEPIPHTWYGAALDATGDLD